MKLKVVAKSLLCRIFLCPTIYKTDKKSFIVKGKSVGNKMKSKLSLAKDEEAVEIPIDLIQNLIKNFNK